MNNIIETRWDETIIVALGSNLGGEYGSSSAVLDYAFKQFPRRGLVVKAKSSLWRSEAWPDPSEPEYLNAVALIATDLLPAPLLGVLNEMEADAGRRRTVVNESRVLDLDLIAYGRRVCVGDDLVLPHPRAAERRFVMGPLAEIAASWRHPVTGESAETLAAKAMIGCDAAPR